MNRHQYEDLAFEAAGNSQVSTIIRLMELHPDFDVNMRNWVNTFL